MGLKTHWVRSGVCLGLLCLGLGQPLVASSPAPAAASPQVVPSLQAVPLQVHAVELRSDAPLPKHLRWSTLCAFKPGDLLSETAVRRTLSNLYATGRVEQAEILARPLADDPSRVTAVVVVLLRPWVDEVEIRGEPALRERLLARALRQKPSSPLSNEQLAASRDALLELFWDAGYRQPQLEMVTESLGPKRVRVVFQIDAGRRATVGSVVFDGDFDAATVAQLRDVARTRPGRPYRREVLERDIERLQVWWVKQGHLAASVGEPEEVYDSEQSLVNVRFSIDAGDPYTLEVVGASRRRLSKLGLLSFLRDPSFDETLVQQSCQKLVTHYQRKGYFGAVIDCRLEDASVGRKLVFSVDKGEVHRIQEVTFVGNDQVANDELEPLMRTSTRRRLSPGSGRLVLDDLEEDLANLRSYYLLQGFLEAQVGPVEPRLDGRSIYLKIPVAEGQRRRVVELAWQGHELFSDDEIARALALRSGGPYHPALLEESINVLRTLYEDQGYPAASIEPRLDWNDDRTLVDIDLDINEGRQAVLDRIILRGLQRTRSAPVLRSIGLEPGEPISRRRLLEAERELYRLGIFSRVDVEVAPSSELGAARDVVVEVEEGQRWRLGYGFSYHSDDGLGGLFSLVRHNIGGRGDRFQFDFRGNDVENRLRLIFDQPSFLRTNLPITFILFREEEIRQAFTVDGTGAQISLTKDWGRNRLGLIYDYRRVKTEILDEFLTLPDLDRQDRNVDISSLTPNFFVDRRDDPLNPTQGWSTNLQFEVAFPLLSAEANFVKLFWQQTQYTPLGRLGGLAGSFRLGAIEGLSDTAPLDPLVPSNLPSARVPVSERFFAGGRTSHRAYDRDSLGVAGSTLIFDDSGRAVEVGGNGLLILNTEYRFPISGDFGGTVFFDLGNVWADWRDFDIDQLEAGAGLGFRYASPIGPIRLEIGWKLDPAIEGDSQPVFFLSFGNPF